MDKWTPEYDHVPAQLRDQQHAVESMIRQAFHGVSREGGTTWSEAEVIDDYGTEEEQITARAADTESCWEDLVEDATWDEEAGVGGFPFLDEVGFCYYIAPAMIRCARRGGGEFVSYALQSCSHWAERSSPLTKEQMAATARFIRFMIDTHTVINDRIYGEPWQIAYKYWRKWDDNSASR